MAEISTATDQNFDSEVLDSSVPVLVDFWADWCHPCHILEPHVKAIAAEYEGKLRVAKLNIDENPEIARRFGVMSIPTLLLFIDGAEKERLIGAQPKASILSQIEHHFTSAA